MQGKAPNVDEGNRTMHDQSEIGQESLTALTEQFRAFHVTSRAGVAKPSQANSSVAIQGLESPSVTQQRPAHNAHRQLGESSKAD